jgi:glycosyltransferase involved in cell wall biosynthesis
VAKLIRITTIPLSLHKLLGGQLAYMARYHDVIGVSSNGKEIELIEQEQGIKVHRINMTRSITPLRDLIAIIRLALFFMKEKPDIVHSHTPKAGLVSMLAARLAGVKIRMHTVAGLPLMETSGFRFKLLKSVEKLVGRTATTIYSNSYKLRDYMLKNHLVHESKLRVIGSGSTNGINLSYFSRTESVMKEGRLLHNRYGISDEHLVFCFIGRIVIDKGITELVDAFSELSKTFPQIRLFMVGNIESELAQGIEQTMRSNQAIIQTGYQEDVRPYLAISDVFVFPSYREGFPNVVLQASSFNLPSIVTNINGSNEIIEDGKNGLIIPKKDKISLTAAMEKFVVNRGLSRELGDNARELVAGKYDQKLVWELWKQEYETQLRKYVP